MRSSATILDMEHRFVTVVILAGGLVGACKGSSNSSGSQGSSSAPASSAPAKQATELVIGPYKLAIPEGWRDLHETQPGTPADPVEIAIERDGDYEAIVHLRYNAAQTATSCDDLANVPAKKDADYHATEVGSLHLASGEDGCRWRFTDAGNSGVTGTLKTADQHTVVVKCIHGAKPPPDFDKVCNDVLALIHLPPT